MRNVLPTEERLKNIPFPDPSVNLIDTPVEVIFKIPEKVYVGEDATSFKIGVWDSETQAWSTDFIGQITKEGENKKDPRQVHFTTNGDRDSARPHRSTGDAACGGRAQLQSACRHGGAAAVGIGAREGQGI